MRFIVYEGSSTSKKLTGPQVDRKVDAITKNHINKEYTRLTFCVWRFNANVDDARYILPGIFVRRVS